MKLGPHPIAELLIRGGLSDADSFEVISGRVRDRDDVHALRCSKSGVIILNRVDHIGDETYLNAQDLSYWGKGNRDTLLATTADDDQRRAGFLEQLGAAGRYLDIGTGLGGILDRVKARFDAVSAVELQSGARDMLKSLGYEVFASISEAPKHAFDVISLFHVYEHIPEQIAFLSDVRQLLKPSGRIVIEVPHAKDALLSLYKSADFQSFTLWSQHLILHTRESLEVFLQQAGMRSVKIQGIQRYPLANHLHWLAMHKPGGHKTWLQLRTPGLEREYELILDRLDLTDTLIAVCS